MKECLVIGLHQTFIDSLGEYEKILGWHLDICGDEDLKNIEQWLETRMDLIRSGIPDDLTGWTHDTAGSDENWSGGVGSIRNKKDS